MDAMEALRKTVRVLNLDKDRDEDNGTVEEQHNAEDNDEDPEVHGTNDEETAQDGHDEKDTSANMNKYNNNDNEPYMDNNFEKDETQPRIRTTTKA